MERISISVRIPALGNSYDFMVPNHMSVKDAQELIIQILHSEYGILDRTRDVMLVDMSDRTALRMECSFAQLGIWDGARLLMI